MNIEEERGGEEERADNKEANFRRQQEDEGGSSWVLNTASTTLGGRIFSLNFAFAAAIFQFCQMS